MKLSICIFFFFILSSCSESIKTITFDEEEIKQECEIKKSKLELAEDNFYSQNESPIRTGNHIKELVDSRTQMNQTRQSVKFWCEKIKPNTVYYTYNDSIFLTKEDAEFNKKLSR